MARSTLGVPHRGHFVMVRIALLVSCTRLQSFEEWSGPKRKVAFTCFVRGQLQSKENQSALSAGVSTGFYGLSAPDYSR
jgi:hypothetical protein